MDDIKAVSRQLGRRLSCDMTTILRCDAGFPVVIQNAPATFDGAPFPTLYWLTCPALRVEIARFEAENMADFKTLLLSPDTRDALATSDSAYRSARLIQAKNTCVAEQNVGIGGCRDPFHLKCLHAHAADYLAAGLNPIGRKVMELAPMPPACNLCATC